MLKGSDGVVKIGATATVIGWVQSWNIDTQADRVAGWGMGDVWETGFTTIKRWSGSAVVYLDPSDQSFTLEAGGEYQVELYPGGETSGSAYWSGTIQVTGTPVDGAKDGIPSQTINFSGNGTVTKGTVA